MWILWSKCDTVNDQSLLEKLALYSFDFCSTSLLANYLSDCSLFIVCMEGVEPKIKPILSGVPRGSILGPLLFLIKASADLQIDGICSVGSKSKVCLFTDDATLYATSKWGDKVFRIIKDDLDSINKWFSLNHLVINWKKGFNWWYA